MRRSILTAGMLLCMIAAGCSTQSKLREIRRNSTAPVLALSGRNEVPELDIKAFEKDTLTVLDESGKEVLIMRASLDENGDMVANDYIDAATVTARFRNVAERHGKVDISFDVTVPKSMQDSKWQLRFYPDLFVLEDSTRLDPVIITGAMYRKGQIRGIEAYNRFISSIVTDSTKLYFAHQLETFIARNMPEIHKFRNDTSFVSEDAVSSLYGVTQQQAVEHYTKWLVVHSNQRKISKMDKKYRRYVKAPIVKDGLRLDTVITNADNDIVYRYTQTIQTRPDLRKAEVRLSGEIFEQDRMIYRMPGSEPLSFYISSLSSFADDTERYMKKIVERRVSANASCSIDFARGSVDIDPEFGMNAIEIERIEDYLSRLIEDSEFDIDSIIVTSSCSPEGSAKLNDGLSLRRSESVSRYFSKISNGQKDTILFVPRSSGENWEMLSRLVAADSLMEDVQKHRYTEILGIADVDARESALKAEPFYGHLLEQHFPKLRTVRFDFHLHRKGMVKDIVSTTVPDSTYMRGVRALKDRDYETAVTLLAPYKDYNAAVAYCAMDYNYSAMDILQGLDPEDKVLYMKAILYSRMGDHANAVQNYLDACTMNRDFINRGNLDPEISELIRTYNLNKEQ